MPSILENLTSALQSVQKLITNSNIDVTATSSKNNEPNKINSSLETLTSAINSLSSNTALNNQEKKSSQKRQQQSKKPTYNPTPIKDLKNVNNNSLEKQDSDDEDDDCELICIKRRKKSEQSETSEVSIKTTTTLTNEETAISCPKLFKPEKRIGKDSASLLNNKNAKVRIYSLIVKTIKI